MSDSGGRDTKLALWMLAGDDSFGLAARAASMARPPNISLISSGRPLLLRPQTRPVDALLEYVSERRSVTGATSANT